MMPHMPAQNNNKKIVDITFCLIKEQMLQLKTALMTNITPIYQEKYYFYLFFFFFFDDAFTNVGRPNNFRLSFIATKNCLLFILSLCSCLFVIVVRRPTSTKITFIMVISIYLQQDFMIQRSTCFHNNRGPKYVGLKYYRITGPRLGVFSKC